MLTSPRLDLRAFARRAAPVALLAGACVGAGPPAVSTAGAGWIHYGVGTYPTGAFRPYEASSPFNRLTDGQAYHPRSASVVTKVLSLGTIGNLVAGTAGTTSDWGHPTYWAQPTDPVFRLSWAGGGPGSTNGMRIRIPDAAKPAGGGDHHMTVVEPDGWEYDFWNVTSKPRGGGTLVYGGGGRTRVDGYGLASGATAANFGNLAGVIRGPELAAGSIRHALFIVLKCTAKGTAFGYGTRTTSNGSYVYPASHGGSACPTDSPDLPPIGTRFRLALTASQIAAMPLPAWKRTILTALARYGGYVGDTGGPGFAFLFESGATYTSFGVADPLVAFARASKLPSSNGFYTFDMASGFDWARYLRVLVPPQP